MYTSLTCTDDNVTKKGWKGRRLLLELANLNGPTTSADIRHFAKYYPEVFDRVAHDEEGMRELLENLRRFLQLAWNAPNARERNWHLFTVRQEYVRGILATFAVLTRDGRGGREVARRITPGVPPKTSFDLAVHHAQTRLANKMAVCARKKECDTPYFLLRRKGQKYCGTECRAIVLKQRSRDWWAKHGKRWRAERKKVRKSLR
jgi:hypothetical protein